MTGNKILPKELNEFNWGACFLTFIWGIKYKAWITLLAVPLILIQLPLGINWILLIIFQIYCGFKGNEWVYRIEWWKKPSDFRKTQEKWAILALILSLILPFISLGILIRFIKKSPDNVKNLISNAQCSVSYKKIKAGMARVKISDKLTAEETAKRFAANNFNSTIKKDKTIVIKLNGGPDQFDEFNVIFEKRDSRACSIKNQNCIIRSSYDLPSEVSNFAQCEFYYDTNKNVVPANKHTKEAIDVGLNLFEYL